MTERILHQNHSQKQVSTESVADISTLIDQALLALHTPRLIDQQQKLYTWLAEHPEDYHDRN